MHQAGSQIKRLINNSFRIYHFVLRKKRSPPSIQRQDLSTVNRIESDVLTGLWILISQWAITGTNAISHKSNRYRSYTSNQLHAACHCLSTVCFKETKPAIQLWSRNAQPTKWICIFRATGLLLDWLVVSDYQSMTTSRWQPIRRFGYIQKQILIRATYRWKSNGFR